MADPKIIILNGTTSVGKSSTARALQKLLPEPYLHVQLDAFLAMLPPAMMDHPDGIVFKDETSGGVPAITLEMGPVMDRLLRGSRSAVAALAAEGNNLIVDDIMLRPEDAQYYRNRLAEYDFAFVGLFAPLTVLEQREKDRGDRHPGLARWQYERIHKGMAYAVEVDTASMTPSEVATHIAKRLVLTEEGTTV